MSSFLHVRTMFCSFFAVSFFFSHLSRFWNRQPEPPGHDGISEMGRKNKSRTSNVRQNKNTPKWLQVTYALRHFSSSFKPSPSLHLVVYHHNPTRRWIYLPQLYYLCNPAVTHWWWRSTTVPGAKLSPTYASVETYTLIHRMLILNRTYFLK